LNDELGVQNDELGGRLIGTYHDRSVESLEPSKFPSLSRRKTLTADGRKAENTMRGTYRRPITLRVALVCGAAIFCIFCIPTAGSAWPIGLWDDPTAGVPVVGVVVTTARATRTGDTAVSDDLPADLTSRSGDLELSDNTSITGRRGLFGVPDTDGVGSYSTFARGGSYSGATRRGDGFAGGGDDLYGLAGLTGDLRDRFASLSDDQRDRFAALIDELREKANTANNENEPNGRGRGWGEEQSGRSAGAGPGASNGSVGATSFQVVTVPEPSTVTLLGAGIISAAMFARRRYRRRST
jgi:hypothetical protein